VALILTRSTTGVNLRYLGQVSTLLPPLTDAYTVCVTEVVARTVKNVLWHRLRGVRAVQVCWNVTIDVVVFANKHIQADAYHAVCISAMNALLLDGCDAEYWGRDFKRSVCKRFPRKCVHVCVCVCVS
jgi:hypothetical protein